MAKTDPTKRPLSWHEEAFGRRYQRLKELYDEGSAPVRDFLEADLGDDLFTGLDITYPPDFTLKLRSIYSHPTTWFGMMPNLTDIAILWWFSGNKWLTYPYMGYVMLKSVVKTLALGGFVERKTRPHSLHINDLYLLNTSTQKGKAKITRFLGHEFKHVVQSDDALISLSSAMRSGRYGAERMLDSEDTPGKYVRYLASEAEIQARLYTILVGVYHQYGSWPTNRGSLYKALQSQGVHITTNMCVRAGKIRQNIPAEAQTPIHPYEQIPELYDLYGDKDSVDDLNQLIYALDNDHRDRFFSHTLPRIYGDMLELLGDRYGSKRLGFQRNVQLFEIALKNAQAAHKLFTDKDAERPAADAPHPYEKMLDALTAMPHDDALEFSCLLLSGQKIQLASGVSCQPPYLGDAETNFVLRKLHDHKHSFNPAEIEQLRDAAIAGKQARNRNHLRRIMPSIGQKLLKIRTP